MPLLQDLEFVAALAVLIPGHLAVVNSLAGGSWASVGGFWFVDPRSQRRDRGHPAKAMPLLQSG
jgi:hypothetical protein